MNIRKIIANDSIQASMDGINPDLIIHDEFQDHMLGVASNQALVSLASSMQSISNFLVNGGLSNLLSGYARAQAVKDMLGGLTMHDGRNALDARKLEQNALEIVEQVEAVFRKYESRLKEANRDPNRDPNIHKAKE